MLLVRLLLKTMFYSLVSFDELWGEVDCFKEWIAGELIVTISLWDIARSAVFLFLSCSKEKEVIFHLNKLAFASFFFSLLELNA